MTHIRMVFHDDPDGMRSELELYLGDRLFLYGSFGGEPEDNRRYRDYAWVERAIRGVAEYCGADVEVIEEEWKE